MLKDSTFILSISKTKHGIKLLVIFSMYNLYSVYNFMYNLIFSVIISNVNILLCSSHFEEKEGW